MQREPSDPAGSSPSQGIGPYRILEPLGAGGMGEVFLAYDGRLDRKVAIKRIRPEAGANPDRRERFRREARMAARLSHPAIVQVFDILEKDGSDYIVMEYVEGTSLRDLVDRGPLEVRQVLDLARELADGLDAAHRDGIVHRDLKTENVLITPSGRPKILDFGIAKRLLAGGEEDSLTGSHIVLGTFRSMSPEQARGEPLDHRTDLFALGVLLYEALTGRSPFAAQNAATTLTRVMTWRPAPVRELNPAVPEGLSFLVDHLLEKDPLRRPASAGQVRRELDGLALSTLGMASPAAAGTEAGTLVEPLRPVPPVPAAPSTGHRTQEGSRALQRLTWIAVAAALPLLGAFGYLALRDPEPPLYVAVLAPEVRDLAGAGEFDLLASNVRAALLRGLISLEGISPKGADEIGSVTGSPSEIARAVAADEVVSSRLECRSDVCRVSVSRLGADGSTQWTESFEVPTDDFYLITNAVTRQIRRGYPDHPAREKMLELAGTSADLKDFTRLRRRLDERRDADLKPLLDEVAALRERSPRLLDAYLLEADVARRHFAKTREKGDLERAYTRVREARELAPGDPQPLFLLVDVALEARELDRAGNALAELQDLIPGDVQVIERQARLLKARGDLDGAIALLRPAVRRHPSWRRLASLARMEIQNGQISAAREHLDLLLTRSPDNFEGLSLLAQMELSAGSPERAAGLYERILRRSQGLTELSNLSVAYFLLGRYAEAARTLEQAVAREPGNPSPLLNLADAYFLLGEPEKAAPLYRRVVELVDSDPARDSPELLSIKGQALAHLGQGPEAAAAVQEAARLAPENAAIAYEASLVYSVLGETSSAVAQAEKALKLGYEPRWFTFPWFDSLRVRPELQSLLSRDPA